MAGVEKSVDCEYYRDWIGQDHWCITHWSTCEPAGCPDYDQKRGARPLPALVLRSPVCDHVWSPGEWTPQGIEIQCYACGIKVMRERK